MFPARAGMKVARPACTRRARAARCAVQRAASGHGGAPNAGADAGPGRVAPHSLVHALLVTIVRLLSGTCGVEARAVSRSERRGGRTSDELLDKKLA